MRTDAKPATGWPIKYEDVVAARERISPFLQTTPLRSYLLLDQEINNGIKLFVKHENYQPTNAFKARNGLSALTALNEEERKRGVVAATRGNHGLGLAWAGNRLGIRVVICVPEGNNPDKNAEIKALGAELIVKGETYDESVAVALELSQKQGLRLVHSTNEPNTIAGAGTIALEILEQKPDIEAFVVPVGGGSIAVGSMTVAKKLKPDLKVYGVQTELAPAQYKSWLDKTPHVIPAGATIAEGLATGMTYELTFDALCQGLSGFVTVSEEEIYQSIRTILRCTHSLVEGAGAVAFAGALKLRKELAGKKVAIILSGANIDQETLSKVVLDKNKNLGSSLYGKISP